MTAAPSASAAAASGSGQGGAQQLRGYNRGGTKAPILGTPDWAAVLGAAVSCASGRGQYPGTCMLPKSGLDMPARPAQQVRRVCVQQATCMRLDTYQLLLRLTAALALPCSRYRGCFPQGMHGLCVTCIIHAHGPKSTTVASDCCLKAAFLSDCCGAGLLH